MYLSKTGIIDVSVVSGVMKSPFKTPLPHRILYINGTL